MTDGTPPEKKQPATARFRGSRWPGLIWAVPVAAAGIVIWLGLEDITKRGPEVTALFPTAGGIKAGNTDVHYRGMIVGHVIGVHLTKSLDHMKVSMRFNSDMAGHLGQGTEFWIAGNSVSLSNLSSLKSIISGPHIDIMPRSGKVASDAIGLLHEPALHSGMKGETLVLVADRPGNISSGAAIYFHDFKVGKIGTVKIRPDGKSFAIEAFINEKYEHFMSTTSRFWNAGGARFQITGSGPKLDLQSLPALVSGAVAFETPLGGTTVPAGSHFHLYKSETAAHAAPGPHAVPYRVTLQGGSHGLAPGAAVTLEGTDAGVVTKVTTDYDPNAGALLTNIDLALEPHFITLAPPDKWDLAHPAAQMNAMLSTLIGKGLRAHRTRTAPAIGAQTVALDMLKGVPPATLGSGLVPEIPSSSASSIAHIMTQVSAILANVHEATSKIAAVSRSPRTKRTLERLDRTITHIDAITRTTSQQMPQLLASLRHSLRETDAALQSAQNLLSQQGGASNGEKSGTLPRALYQLTQAARSLRELTDYLSGHPNSVIFGKGC